MSKKEKSKLIKQTIVASENSVKKTEGEDKKVKEGKVHDNKSNQESKVKRRSGKSKSNDSKKKAFNLAEAEANVAKCQSVFIPKSDTVSRILFGGIILTKFIAALDAKLQLLKVPAYMRSALRTPRGTKAAIGAFAKPTLDDTRLVTVQTAARELTTAETTAYVASLRTKWLADQAEKERLWNEDEDQREINHNAGQLKLEDEHFKAEAVKKAAHDREEQNKRSGTRSSTPIVPYSVTPFTATPYTRTAYTAQAFVPPTVPSSAGANIEMCNGIPMIKPKVQVFEEQVTIAAARVGIAAGIYQSPELQQLIDENKAEVNRFNEEFKEAETNARNFTNIICDSFSYESNVAIAADLVGGNDKLQELRSNNSFLEIIDAFLNTHDYSNQWDSMTDAEKENFIRQEEAYLSAAKLKQGDTETVTQYVNRMTKRFDLSIKLKSIAKDLWRHDEQEWIRMLVKGVNGKNDQVKTYNLCLQGCHGYGNDNGS